MGLTLRIIQSTGKPSKAVGREKGERSTRNTFSHEFSEEQIKAGFEARKASPAYQQMLVSICRFCCLHNL
jgi:hypothetical protein